ncbi:MAG: glutamate-5-semialdehyde dehydrogenase [Candidatus Omnitrophica bacterium]|jgi:glutamate-5-semialdehyde dehydrogenase|nr:glutamate-5-semialdehyde dehydrogenase [Candidatus Omnitrophota bacterium]
MNRKEEMIKIAKLACGASRFTANLSAAQKNAVLRDMAAALISSQAIILKANALDLKKARNSGLKSSFIDRLALDKQRIRSMADSLLQVSKLDDPVGTVIKSWKVKNGLSIRKERCAIGVIAIIYEARPNVTSDCLGLCFKSGNSVILRGGSEAINSNLAIFNVLNKVLLKHKIPQGAASFVKTTDRKAVDALLKLNDYIDLVIPRGGEGLIKHVVASSRIPVIKHYKGICHVYVDDEADLNMAENICLNAKLQRPGVCNAMECLLVHRDLAARFLPGMLKKFKDAGVQIRGCAFTKKLAKWVKLATEKDYRTEYLGLALSVKVVNNLDEAIEHINNYGSHHSDSIVTDNKNNALKFLKRVDSACVYQNASTRFTDGFQFGMGAEIGISTDKLHARGPMALEELTTYKYMVFGNGQLRR